MSLIAIPAPILRLVLLVCFNTIGGGFPVLGATVRFGTRGVEVDNGGSQIWMPLTTPFGGEQGQSDFELDLECDQISRSNSKSVSWKKICTF